MTRELKTEFKLISFLDEESLARLNEIAKRGGIKYVKKYTKKETKEHIDYKKLMEQGSRSRI